MTSPHTTTDPNSEPLHIWSRCHHCGAQPIRGTRFECITCPPGPDSDLCAGCRELVRRGQAPHPPRGSYAEALAGGDGTVHELVPVAGVPLHLGSASWPAVPQPTAPPPAVAAGLVVRPEFCVGRESFVSTYAFAAHGDNPLLLTALHVLGPLLHAKKIDCSRRNSRYSGRELPALVTKVNLYDVLARQWVLAEIGEAGRMLVLPEARIGDQEPLSQQDVAAFRITSGARLAPARLADAPPQVGEPIWLVAAPLSPQRAPTVPAVVVEQTEQTLIFRYADPAGGPDAVSGTPLLDRHGAVVGITVGGGLLDGVRYGHGCHVGSIRRHLERSAGDGDRSTSGRL